MPRLGPRSGPTLGPLLGPNPTLGEVLGATYDQPFEAEAGDSFFYHPTIAGTLAHGLNDGDGPFRLTTTGVLPGGYSTGVNYYVRQGGGADYLVSMCVNRADALVGINGVAMSDAGSGDLRLQSTSTTTYAPSYPFTADPIEEWIVVVSPGYGTVWQDGDGPLRLTTTGSLPAPLATDVDYWIATGGDPDSYHLCASRADALARVWINLTDAGVGVHTLLGTHGATVLHH